MAARAKKKATKKPAKKSTRKKSAKKTKAAPKAEGPEWHSELGLTVKQESFAQHYVAQGVASRSYRDAYNAKNMKPETIWKRAHELLRNGKVAGRIRELRTAIAEAAGIDKAALVANLMQERDLALLNGEPQHATKATKELIDLLGFRKGQVEITFPDLPPLTPEEMAALSQAADEEL